MRVRLIAGSLGGRFIEAPGRASTHPMGERVRAALFNSLAGQVSGTRVLDAFAGSGAIGLEALSRGATFCTFVESDRVAARIIAENIETLGVEDQAELIRTTAGNWLTTAKPEPYDLIFADPPYGKPQFSTVTRLFGLLKPNGLMILSHSGRGEVPIQNGIVVVDNRSYGNAYLTFFRLEE